MGKKKKNVTDTFPDFTLHTTFALLYTAHVCTRCTHMIGSFLIFLNMHHRLFSFSFSFFFCFVCLLVYFENEPEPS